jgi:hypothetical protein
MSGEFTGQVDELFLKQRYIANSRMYNFCTGEEIWCPWIQILVVQGGHLIQNMCLISTAQGLGTLTLGACNPLR